MIIAMNSDSQKRISVDFVEMCSLRLIYHPCSRHQSGFDFLCFHRSDAAQKSHGYVVNCK